MDHRIMAEGRTWTLRVRIKFLHLLCRSTTKLFRPPPSKPFAMTTNPPAPLPIFHDFSVILGPVASRSRQTADKMHSTTNKRRQPGIPVQRNDWKSLVPLQLMNTLLKTDIEIATHVAMYGGTEKDALRLRRRSEPLTRKKSSMSYLSARSETDTAVATDVRSPSKAACHCYRLFFFLFFFLTCPPFLPRSFSLIVYLSFCLILFSSLGLSLSLFFILTSF